MDAIRPYQDGTPIPVPHHQPTASPDLVKILLRWKWLPILGTILGATIGFLVFCQIAPKYKAIAQVQVVTPGKEVPINSMDRGSETFNSKADELVVIQSPVVLAHAVEIGHLTQHRRFIGKSTEDIVRMLRRPKVLDVKQGTTDTNSDIIKIGVTTDDPELSGEIAKSIVSGYEEFVTSKFKGYSREAFNTLTKFSEIYENRRTAARTELEKLRTNSNLIWIDGKPRDPVAEKIIKFNEKILELDSQTTNINAILQQVDSGKSANRSAEELLRMVTSSTRDSGFRIQEDADITMQRDLLKNKYMQLDHFEQEKVVPAESELALLIEQNLGDSHPTVVTARQKRDRLKEELARRKANINEVEVTYGANKSDLPSIDARLTIACGALKETRQKFQFEKEEYESEVKSLREQMQENQAAVSNFAINVADLEAVSQVASQISENLRKLSLGTEFGQKTVTRLEIPDRGSFDGPFWIQYIGIGGMLGFMAFCGFAYLLELADRSYRNPDEISADLGMPIIGHLPLVTIARTDREDEHEHVDSSIITLHQTNSPMSEAFRGMRTAMFFACQQGGVKVIQVTSPVPGDGKSTVAANIAVSIAQSGRKVCLVDCDFRRPRVAKMFGLKDEIGLSQVIAGKATLDEAIQETSIENFYSITCGRKPSNPAELLSSELVGTLMGELRSRFDYVIVDTPPMLAVSDPANVATHVDGVILAIRLRRNLKPIASRAAQMLHAINANMLGVVVNGIGITGQNNSYGGYRYDNYSSNRSGGYGKNGYGGYGYGSTFQYGGYYGGNRDYLEDKPVLTGTNEPTLKS